MIVTFEFQKGKDIEAYVNIHPRSVEYTNQYEKAIHFLCCNLCKIK